MKGIVIDLKDISDSRELMESKESPKIRWFIYIMTAAVVTALILSCILKMDVYFRVRGEVKTQDAVSSVVSMNNCKLNQIRVTEGKKVQKGEVLFVLDSEYAETQKEMLEQKLKKYDSDFENTRLMRTCIEEDRNLFLNSAEDSKFYYRFEQYKNGILLAAHDISNSVLTDSLSKEEKKNSLASLIDSLADQRSQIEAYRSLLRCIQNDDVYSGANADATALYEGFAASYQKSLLLCDDYKSAYERIRNARFDNSSENRLSAADVEAAKMEVERAYSKMNDYKSSYLMDVRTQLILIENQLITNSENSDLQAKLKIYRRLQSAVEQKTEFQCEDPIIQDSFDRYISVYSEMNDEYDQASAAYQSLYGTFSMQNSASAISDADVEKARTAYETAALDLELTKNSYISQVQNKISALETEISGLEDNRKSLELSLKKEMDSGAYEKLTADKLKNDALITVNSELDSLNDNIISIKSQIAEIEETIRQSEIKASVSGTVTLINEISTGDIVQAGSTLCNIIPDENELKVTLYIPEHEIAKVQVHQKTEYVIDAIPYDEYGKITGEIVSVSADAVYDEATGSKYYIAQASLSANALKNREGDVRKVKNGMLLEAKSISGSKSVITWFLEKMNFME